MEPSASAIYNQLIVFQNEEIQSELIFHGLSPANQTFIQTLARGLDLEFEYSTITNSARISHRLPVQPQPVQGDLFAFLNLEQTSAQHPDRGLPNAYDPPPSATVDWEEMLGIPDGMELFPSQDDAPMFSSEPAFPKLDHPLYHIDVHHKDVPSTNLDLDLDLDFNEIISNFITVEEQTPAWALARDMPMTQPSVAMSQSFQVPLCSQPATTMDAPRDIRRILVELGMGRYANAFLQNGFDTWESILDITESDFDTFGVKLGHRRKLQHEISKSKFASCQQSVEPSRIVPDNYIQSAAAEAESKSVREDIARLRQELSKLIEKESSMSKTQDEPVPRRHRSRAGSVSSRKSDNGRNRITKPLSRRGSTQESALPGYQVWDSRSTKSAATSIASATSTKSTGRRGPLSGAARAIANAVKAAKACWRCKFMRKPCDVELPCESCPNRPSAWFDLGCRRGELKDEMPELRLCPEYDPRNTLDCSPRNGGVEDLAPYEYVNECAQNANERRQEALSKALTRAIPFFSSNYELDRFAQSLEPFHSNRKRAPREDDNTLSNPLLETSDYVSLKPLLKSSNSDLFVFVDRQERVYPERKSSSQEDEIRLKALRPLHECIFLIVCEARECPILQSTLGANHTMLEELVLLRSAANYQARYESDKLIALSLICLRTSLESLRTISECADNDIHTACASHECKIHCIISVEDSLRMYVSELSRVFFKKHNLRSKHWWLSAFYSFCIQSIVRNVLTDLVGYWEDEILLGDPDPCLVVKQYLVVALCLFVATSGTYDPLQKEYSESDPVSLPKTDAEKASKQDFREAQDAVKQKDWKSNGISSSMEYLESLF